jgi:hypothetical protein
MPAMKGYKFSDTEKRAKKIDKQSKPGKPGTGDEPFNKVLRELEKAGSGSGSHMRRRDKVTVNNLTP